MISITYCTFGFVGNLRIFYAESQQPTVHVENIAMARSVYLKKNNRF